MPWKLRLIGQWQQSKFLGDKLYATQLLVSV